MQRQFLKQIRMFVQGMRYWQSARKARAAVRVLARVTKARVTKAEKVRQFRAGTVAELASLTGAGMQQGLGNSMKLCWGRNCVRMGGTL